MDIVQFLEKSLPNVLKERDFSFARHVTVGCGGIAALALAPESIEGAAECISVFERERIPYCFLGAGANVLPRDGRFEGAVLRFCRLKELSLEESLFAGAGVTGGELLSFAKSRGVTGFEPFAGIPTSVGGGVAMNAGIAVRHFSDLVERVIACERGKIKIFSPDECRFELKRSVFLDGIAVLGVYFKAERATQAEIEAETKRYLERRKHLPKGRSMGCTFVNPEGISAGALIERCGLKGRAVGRARVSEEHANFIINEGTCSNDVARLIDEIKEEVFLRTGVRLREEIRRIP